MIHGMNHFTITAEDRAKTLDFYLKGRKPPEV